MVRSKANLANLGGKDSKFCEPSYFDERISEKKNNILKEN